MNEEKFLMLGSLLDESYECLNNFVYVYESKFREFTGESVHSDYELRMENVFDINKDIVKYAYKTYDANTHTSEENYGMIKITELLNPEKYATMLARRNATAYLKKLAKIATVKEQEQYRHLSALAKDMGYKIVKRKT